MTLTSEDRDCTENCKSSNHGDIITASLTKGCVSEADLCCFINYVCCCCESVKDSFARTALHVAASCGKIEVIKWLCKHKNLNINARDVESGYTALHRSIFYGKLNAAVCLMKLGANILLQDFDGLTILEHAMYDQRTSVCGNGGEIYVWGSNTNNTLGPQQARLVPEIMDIFHKENPNIVIKQVCLSRFHCAIVSTDGRVFSCGHGQGGRLGLSTEQSVLIPKAINKFNNNNNNKSNNIICVKASTAQDHSVFLTESGHILTCGLNTHRVLGFSPPPEKLTAPRQLQHFLNPVTEVIAMKYHTVAWCSNAIYTWGLHAGQLGHDKSANKYIITPKQVPHFHSNDSTINLVAGSIGATAFLTSSGDIYVLHEYQCRKIAGKQLDVVQLSIIGGKLNVIVDNCVASDCHPLKICVLTGIGNVLMWQENDQQLLRCIFSINRSINVKQISLNINHLLIVTKNGEAFQGLVKERKKRNSNDAINTSDSAFHKYLNKNECRLVKVEKIPKIHRAMFIESDLEGKNFAVIQMNPRSFLTILPDISPSTIKEDIFKLLENTDEFDEIHDVIFKVGIKTFFAHRFICASYNMEALNLQLDSTDKVTVEISGIHPIIFKQFLIYIYSGTCDLLVPEKYCTYMEELKIEAKGTDSVNSKIKDPIRLLHDCARQLGLRLLQKRLEHYSYNNGYVNCRNYEKSERVFRFDRNSYPELCDVIIKTKNEKQLMAHKCILIARSEYFNNLFSFRWTQQSGTQHIFLNYSYSVVEYFLEFLYTDQLVALENEDIEIICNLLILADEYFIDRLKQFCELALTTHITLRNVSQMFTFSYTYNAQQLRECCKEFISLNLSAVLESRCLDDIDETFLKDLSEFYSKWNPIFEQRVITPYSTAPEDEFVQEIARKYPFTPRTETKSAKAVVKKKMKTHRSKMTTPNINDSDKENVVKDSNVSSEIDCKEETDTQNSILNIPVRIEAINSALKQIETEPIVTNFTTLSTVNLESFPELGSSPTSAGFSKSPKTPHETKTKIVKLSQKQRKRLLSESSIPTPQSEVTETPKNPWKLCTEMSSQDSPTVATQISAEKKQKENLSKMLSKSLVLTQKEDKAIEDLYKFYNVENVFDEIITVERVRLQLVGSPVWVQRQKL